MQNAFPYAVTQPKLAAVINITPDSFSGDGTAAAGAAPEALCEQALAHGAAMVDIGAQSTRPGAALLTSEEETARLKPHLPGIVRQCQAAGALCSVDTFHAATAAFALEAGAHGINDVSAGLRPDGAGDNGEMSALLRRAPEAFYVFMHHVTVPADKTRTLPEGADVIALLQEWRDARVAALAQAGIAPERLIFDPGIGFGKTAAQSLEIMRHIAALRRPDMPVLIGCSRKSFFLPLSGETRAEARDPETVAASLYAAQAGADWLRVHNIIDNAKALRVFAALTARTAGEKTRCA